MPRITAFIIAFAIFFTTSTAWAIQGYKDRHGVFYGFGVGGGPGAVHIDNELSGLEGTGDLGLHLHGILGGGLSENLTFGAETNAWIRTVSVGSSSLNHQHWSFNAVGNLFVLEGLFLEGGLGLAYAFSDATAADGSESRYQEMGLAFKAGTGFEYFLDGTVAAGMRFGYTRHVYSNIDFDTFIGSVTLRWY